MQNNDVENMLQDLTKEQAFKLGMLFSFISMDNLIKLGDKSLESLSLKEIEGIAKGISMPDKDLQFYLEFRNKVVGRDELARKYNCCTSNIYPKYKAIKRKLEANIGFIETL